MSSASTPERAVASRKHAETAANSRAEFNAVRPFHPKNHTKGLISLIEHRTFTFTPTQITHLQSLLDAEKLDFNQQGLEPNSTLFKLTAHFDGGEARISVYTDHTRASLSAVFFKGDGRILPAERLEQTLDGDYYFKDEDATYVLTLMPGVQPAKRLEPATEV